MNENVAGINYAVIVRIIQKVSMTFSESKFGEIYKSLSLIAIYKSEYNTENMVLWWKIL